MKRLLVLFANSFPFNISEPFLEKEYPLYSAYYDKILLVSACERGEQATREISDDRIEVLRDYTLSKDVRSILAAIPYMLTDRMFYREWMHLIRDEGFTWRKMYDLVVFSLCGNHRARQAKGWIRKHPEYQVESIYAYWFYIPAYAALRLKGMLKGEPYTVSRAHGYDLYVERHATGYIPFHRQMYNGLDAVASISKQGKAYLEERYGVNGRVGVHRLGAAEHALCNPSADRRVFRVVTCARTIPLKRLNRLADALCAMTDVPIEWLHVGDGPVQKELERYAKEKMPANVKVMFAGSIPNTAVYEIYGQQPFHVFINVSETEGVPVSIMEAMSFGIPVIATDVGGTAELVDEGVNGFLLQKDFSDVELTACISGMIEMPEMAYQRMRQAARRKYEQEYSAETNYRRFLQSLVSRQVVQDHM